MPGPRYVRLVALQVALTLLLAVTLIARADSAQATTFSPTLTVTPTDSTPGAHSDILYDFRIMTPDSIFQDVVNFLPPEFVAAADADIPDGAIAGKLNAEATLGLINSSCTTVLPVEFTMLESTTDPGAPLLYPGTEDVDGNGLVGFVEGYPDFLRRMFPGLEPVQRLYGQTLISGVINILNFVVFEPGTQIPFFPAFDPSLGYPTFAVLNDPTYPIYPNPITDFCSPLTTENTVYGVTKDNPDFAGNQAGYTVRTNPLAEGAYVATSFVRSLWDADDDGFENTIDPCPYDAETVWNPRAVNSPGDDDLDGLPETCDPNDNQFNPDQDGDQFYNRQDRCPRVADGGIDNDADGVGDACDRDPADPADGGLSHRHVTCTRSVIQIGSGGPAQTEPPCPTGSDLPALNLELPSLMPVGEVLSIPASLFTKQNYGYYYGGGEPAVTLDFTVTGANTAQGSCLTDNQGHCEFNYLGANTGVDTVTVAATAFGAAVTKTVEWKDPPANDDFADAVEIATLPYAVEAETSLATNENYEVEHCAYGSVWYKFTATEDMFLEAEVEVDGGWANLAVYMGDTLAGLDEMRCTYAAGGLPFDDKQDGYGYFLAEAGETYYFAVSGFGPYDETGFAVEFGLSAVSGGIVTGDLTCDGEVGPQDSLLALKLDAGLPVPECATAFGDTDCDGYVGVLDSLKMLAYDAGVPKPQAPACPAVATAFA